MFSLNFAKFLRTPFLRTSPVVASEDEHGETKLLYIKSRFYGWTNVIFWTIRYELFWQPVKMDT